MIKVESLTKRYGLFEALKGVSFEISKGEIVGLLGENGAGKSTTMRILASYMPPTSGSVRVSGHDVVFASLAARRSIGYMPESVPLYGAMRVEEFLLYRARLKGLSSSEAKKSMDRVLARVSLADRRRTLIQNLSKGLRQRVGFADALIHDPPVVILDEPTSGLDPTQRVEVRKLVEELRGEHTVVISSHILPEIEATCDRVLVISKGKLVADRSVEELRRLSGSDRFVLTVRGDDSARSRLVGALPVACVMEQRTVDEGNVVMEVAGPKDDGAFRARVVRIAVESGLDVIELRPLVDSVEAAYFKLLEGAEES